MIETIGQWVDAILQWIYMVPREVWAVFIGLTVGGAGTQWLKRTFPATVLFQSKEMAVMYLRIIAFVLSFLPTYFVWDGKHAVWVAAAVGFTTPALYKASTFFLYKKFPELKERLSGTDG